MLESSSDVASLSSIDGVMEIVRGDDVEASDSAKQQWQLQLQLQLQISVREICTDILRSCFEKNISLSRFEFTEPSLHDVFVHLVGDDAKEHAFR
tara:strand:+ start:231 stop:515 length:285 start_codon:yes stop_codon:yes gene_type:complete